MHIRLNVKYKVNVSAVHGSLSVALPVDPTEYVFFHIIFTPYEGSTGHFQNVTIFEVLG
jgi:hypothetical protein